MRKSTGYAGRSINLALSDRGWKALTEIGIADDIKEIAIPMYGRFLHAIDRSTAYQPYGKEGQAIYSVSRAGINCTLMDLAEKHEQVKLHFEMRCSGVDLKNNYSLLSCSL
jgi:kynurenine 3-monooxygenase